MVPGVLQVCIVQVAYFSEFYSVVCQSLEEGALVEWHSMACCHS